MGDNTIRRWVGTRICRLRKDHKWVIADVTFHVPIGERDVIGTAEVSELFGGDSYTVPIIGQRAVPRTVRRPVCRTCGAIGPE